MGPLIPLFWTSGDVCPGFQSQGGSLFCVLFHLCDPQIHLWCNICWLYRGMAVKPFWSTYLQTYPQALVKVWGWVQTHDHLCSTVPVSHSGLASSVSFQCFPNNPQIPHPSQDPLWKLLHSLKGWCVGIFSQIVFEVYFAWACLLRLKIDQ